MAGADGSPPRDADPSSLNDGPVPENDPNYFDKLLTHLRSFLPFLTKVIDSSELLEIQPDHVTKLQCLYELVDNKRLSPDRLKTCKKVFYDLYDSYSNLLNYYLPEDFKTSWMKDTKLNDNEQQISSEVKYTFNKNNQNQNSKSEPSNNLSAPSTSLDNMTNNQPDSLKYLTSNNENTIDKNVMMSESSSSQSVLYDSMFKKNNLPEFSDSRLRLNKIIGFAANASIEKLNNSDASIPHSELTTQIFNELINQDNRLVLYKDMLKGINMDDIDVNYVKEVIEGIKKASCVRPVQPPPLPPSDLMDLGASKINLISTAETNSNEVVIHNTLLSKSTTINRAQSNTDMNKLHIAGSSNDTRQKFISALKPGTLIDLENSKVSRTSLHIESLRPVIKANEKSNDIKTSIVDIGVPRDPRIRKKSLLSSENSVGPIITHASLISNVQNTFSTNIPTIYTPNMDNSKATLFETRAQEISGYNGPSPPNHPNSQMLNLPFYSEHNGGSSVQFQNRPLSQNQNRQNRNDHKLNDFNQFSNSSQMHVIPSHCEPMVKYCEPVPFKVYTNDIVSKRDPRSLKNVSLINKIPFRNYKEYREAKYGKEQNKGLDKNKQMNQPFEKIEKNNTIDSSYNTFGIVNETANIKGFKIPKIKHNEDLIDNSTLKNSKSKMFESGKNNVDVSKTEKNSKIPQNTELKKSNDSKKDTKKIDTINKSHTDKDLKIEISENSNTDIDHKIKTMVNNNLDKNESCPEINPEKITVNIPSEINKDELDSKFEQNNLCVELIEPKKTKKPKKYSKEREFEKIVKEAVESSHDDIDGPRTRTRCSLLKKDKALKTSNVNSPKPKFKKNDKKLESGECSKNLDNVSIPNMKDVNEPIKIGHNIISSTSKEQSEVVNSTTTEILCKSRAENIVSSNHINSTADNNPKIDEKALIDILKNPKFMSVISMFQDENKMEKLNKLLESSDVNINDDKSKNKDILNEEQLDIDKQKKRKRKMKKEKRKRKKMKKNLSEESSNQESVNDISDDSNLNEFDQGNTNSINIYSHSSTNQHKLKSIKCKKSKESYEDFEIFKDQRRPQLKDLKIVITKLDGNTIRSAIRNSDISSTGIDTSTNNKPINIEKAQEMKPKKSFYGPLSVKLARQKMEIEQENSKNKQDNKNQFKFKTKIDEKRLKSTNSCDEDSKLYSGCMIKNPIILPPYTELDENTSKKSVVQNSNISTVIEPNVNVSKPEFKKARLSELDKLHADISEMFDCEAVLNASNIRQCRTNKQIDYVNTNVVSSKKKKASNIEQLDSNDQNELICDIENPKNPKKKVKKSTLLLKNKKKDIKKSTTNQTLPPVVIKTAVLNKISNEQSDKLKKKRKGHKKFKKSNRNQLNNVINDSVLYDESELNNVSNNKTSTEIIPRDLSEYEFKDKSYFQSADNILECKFCNYKGKGLNIVLHFKDKHSEEEVLPSRLPMNCAKPLILQSIKENFLYQNSQDSKSFCHGPMNVNYTCVFCQVIFHDYFKFHDHLTGHTGEYRFKCKMCDRIYSNEDDLDKHILEHEDYDKTNGISHLIYPNPISSKIVFGYLCSFCYYVQLDYNNMVKHMELRHFDEDKKSNGHWTIIRISMSMTDENDIDSPIGFDNLVGCLPPIQVDQVIFGSNDNEDQIQHLTKEDLNIVSERTRAQCDIILSIKKEIIEQMNNEISQFSSISKCSPILINDKNPSESNVDKNLPESIIGINPPESVISMNHPKLDIDVNSLESVIDVNSPESVIGINPPELVIDVNPPESVNSVNHPKLDIDVNSPESIIGVNPPESVIDVNPPESVNSVNHPKLNIDVNYPESVIGVNPPESVISVNHPKSDIDVNSPESVIGVNPLESVIDVNPPESVNSVNHPKLNIDVNYPESVIGVNPPESVISVNHPKLDIYVNSPESVIDVNSPESVIDVNSPETVIDVNHSESDIGVDHPESDIDVKPLGLVMGMNHPESAIDVNSPESVIGVNHPESDISVDHPESDIDVKPLELVMNVNHPKSDIDMNSPETVIGINPPKSVIGVNHSESDIDVKPLGLVMGMNHPESAIDVNSPESVISVNHPESDIDVKPLELVMNVNHPVSDIDVNPPELLMGMNHPESNIEVNPLETNILKFLPEQAYQSPTNETRISTKASDDNFEFTLKGNSIKYTLAGLSCEFINTMALFKCSVLNCSENQFLTEDLIDFYKHINQNHKFVVWDGKCELCHHNQKLVSKQYYIKNALKHLVTHHLLLKNNKEQPNHMINPEGLNVDQSLSSTSQDVNNTPIIVSKLAVRKVDGDILSGDYRNPNLRNICNTSVNTSLSNDTDSINQNDFIEHNKFENSEQSSHMLLGNQCETSVNPEIYHGFNDERVPSLSSSNFNVKSSKKVKGNTFKMNPGASDSDIEIKTIIELVLPSSDIVLEKGHQIVNNGIPINGTIYLIDTDYKKDYDKKVRDLPINVMKTKLAFNEMSALPRLLGLFKCMDRTCTKIFNSKELFKLHMKLHFSNTEKKKKNQIYNVEQFKMCAYCFKMFDDEESLANHIVDKYSFCEYFCPYCFYRAYSASHVLVHQTLIHTKIPKHYTIKLECDYGACDYPKETLLVVDFKEFVLPYMCNVGHCTFSCYLPHEFINHLNENHQQCDKFCCYICSNIDDAAGYYALHPSVMITHFKLHNLNRFQCIFCLFGSEILNPMIKHLASEHFEYEPLCLERSTVSDNCDSKNIKNLKILRLNKVIENGMIEIVNLPADIVSLPEVLPQKSKKRSIECPDALSVAMKSARIEGSQPSDTIVITVPDSAQMGESSTPLSLSIDNEFIMIDDVNQNDMQESLKINRIWSESKIKEKESKVSSTDDIIVIEDEDDLSEKEELGSSTKRICLEQEESTNGSIKVKRLAFPIIELDKLFFCKECEKVFSNGDIYYSHLNVCPFWDSVAGRKCTYCVKVFKTALNMTEHIKLHGPDRFKCHLCDLNVPSLRSITQHMKNIHKIINIDFVPEHPDLTDLNKDVFIVLENKIVEHKKQKNNNLLKCVKCPFKGNTHKIMSHMKAVHNAEENVNCKDISCDKIMQEQPNDKNNLVNSLIPQQNEQQSTSLKRKRSTNSSNQKVPLKEKPIIKDKTKNLFFSPDTIDSIPMSHIFSDPISCSLCTYNTKVRSNLVIHLNGHKKGQDNTTKEIVNPVPSIGKSELMFDKMINLSASSFDAMNTEKMKRDELDKKIVEVAPDDNINTEIFPKFIPKNMRYKCSIPLCDYTGLTEERLKTHISVLHSTYECYTCPHCLPPCSTSKIVEHLMLHGENLYKCQYCNYIDFNRVEMKTHMRNTHLSEISNSVQSNIIVIRQTMPVDDSFDRGRSKVPSNVPQWVCNICSTGLRYTENEITSHILMAHKISNMFKCPMCQFENKDDNPSIFEEHYKSEHPSVAVQCLRVFEMITDKEEWHKPSRGAENFLEQQALESIEPTLVPPTCRGIPIESSPLKMNNKSRGMSKSPKSATKSSSIQPHKQKPLIDIFNKNDKLGAISSNGHFACPKCDVFETINIELFREHLYKEVNYKTWKCLKCFEISDSPKKMAWHVKKHGIGSKYEKIEDGEKLKWVDRVIGHQFFLLTEFNKKVKDVKSVESCRTVIVNNKRTSYSPIEKKNIEREKKEVLLSQPNSDPASNDDIINLVDDSDNE